MGAVTRWSCLTEASVSSGTRRLVLAVSILVLGMLALAARADAYFYFANYGTGTVGRVDQNPPSGFTLDFISAGTDGVAVDSSHIYWSNHLTTFTIGRASIDGTNPDPDFITGVDATAVAVNDRFIYWTNNSITRFDRTRAHRRHGGQPNFIPDLVNVEGIAVDDKHIYWTNGGTPTNQRLDRARQPRRHDRRPHLHHGRPRRRGLSRGRGRLQVHLLDERPRQRWRP